MRSFAYLCANQSVAAQARNTVTDSMCLLTSRGDAQPGVKIDLGNWRAFEAIGGRTIRQKLLKLFLEWINQEISIGDFTRVGFVVHLKM